MWILTLWRMHARTHAPSSRHSAVPPSFLLARALVTDAWAHTHRHTHAHHHISRALLTTPLWTTHLTTTPGPRGGPRAQRLPRRRFFRAPFPALFACERAAPLDAGGVKYVLNNCNICRRECARHARVWSHCRMHGHAFNMRASVCLCKFGVAVFYSRRRICLG